MGQSSENPKSPLNPMGTDGFEFVEYAAPDPAVLASLFESLGFVAVARHRSKDVTLSASISRIPAARERTLERPVKGSSHLSPGPHTERASRTAATPRQLRRRTRDRAGARRR